MNKQTIIINGTRFTVWAESTGIGIVLEDEKTNEKIGEVFTESYDGNHVAHIYHNDSDAPNHSVEIERK
jgi:hypothetical protein